MTVRQVFSFVIIAAGLVLPVGAATAAPLEGSWSGAGTVNPSSGQPERVRCRVNYSRQTAKVYNVSATCASASASLRQTGTLLRVRSNRYVGDVYNSDFDISGRLKVTVKGRKQIVTFTSSAASGRLNLRKR
ncbi:MAG: hypothetical protein AAFV45_06985 [Pseudomonadota bacterium]